MSSSLASNDSSPFVSAPSTPTPAPADAAAAHPQAPLSILPQRDPAVSAILADLDRALNHLAIGPGATISNLFPRLQSAFWKSAWAINAARIAPDAPAAAAIDVRDFPAWLRGRIPEPRLQVTLFPVFNTAITAIKDAENKVLLTRLTAAAKDLQCSLYDVFLDFGDTIATSTHALPKLSKARKSVPALSRDQIVRALWAETLARPDLSPDSLPTPTVRELTKALNKLQPGIASRASSVASSRAGSLAPSRALSRAASLAPNVAASANDLMPPPPPPPPPRAGLPRASKKRAAEAISAAATDIPPAKRRKAAADVELPRRESSTDLSLLSSGGSSSAGRAPVSDEAGPGPQTPSLGGGSPGFGFPEEESDDGLEEDDLAECVEACRRLLAIGGREGPVINDPVLRGSLSILTCSAYWFVTRAEENEDHNDE
ncbi:hypothetical protein CSUB01_12240 [Colletotrichum sublineola]|uniref:Uncharacterized protein n=1 Tax=Colletotrichum sublineola TaxID=1173701 RepID=A0A066WXD7_COLSU|nr:hypothetical protein CSUB01_12240 [Colletotrichum sublineola]